MTGREVAVLDIGSSSVRVVISRRGINGTFTILGVGESEYSGYADGEFIDIDNLKSAVGLAISNAEANSGLAITDLYVGVPAEFSINTTKMASQNYPKRIRISRENVEDLYQKATVDTYEQTHTLVSCTGVFFVLADNRRVIDPVGEKTSRLSAQVSCVYADNTFIEVVNSILAYHNIQNCEYLSTPLAQAVYLLEENQREKYSVIVDCGYISTSVSLVRGNGLVMLNSFSLGGGHISADLSECLHIPFQSAEDLKNKVVLSVSPTPNDIYEASINGRVVPMPMQTTNMIVCARIDMIASAINKCLLLCKQDRPEFMDVYLTGGGLSYIKGAKDQLSKSIGANVRLIAPKDAQMSKPHLSSSLGLLDMALTRQDEIATTFSQKIKAFLANMRKR